MAPSKTPDPPGMDTNMGVNWDDVYGKDAKFEVRHMHSEKGLCKTNIDRVASPFPLLIRGIETDGADCSGLFTEAVIEPGRDIYRVCPMMAVPDRSADFFCHYCLESSQDFGRKKTPPKACTGCKAARFCSKVSSPTSLDSEPLSHA